jgi:hypothetical protein
MTELEQIRAATGHMIKEDGTLANMADLAESSLGGKGLVVIADTALHTATSCYCAIEVLTDAVIEAYTVDASAPITGTLTGVTFTAGKWLYGKFLTLKLTSGTLLAYHGVL